MRFFHWIAEELKILLAVTLYFTACFVLIMVLKQLLLTQYGIEFSGITTALLVALVTAKVVIVLEKVPLSHLYDGQPAIVDLLARTVLYTFATLLALLLEKAFEARGEHGGFWASAAAVFEHRDAPQVWATTIWVGLAFTLYNAFGILCRAIGGQELKRVFFSRPLGQR